MVINNFNLVGAEFGPHKANAILVIDADAVLTFSVTRQGFQSVVWRDSQFAKGGNRINLIEFSGGNLPQGSWANLSRFLCVFAVENVFRVRIFEGLDHADMIA
jgi:hypothetical protein